MTKLDSFAVIQHLFSVAVLLYNAELVAARLKARRSKLDKLADVHPTTRCEVQVTTNHKSFPQVLSNLECSSNLSSLGICERYFAMSIA